MGLLDTTRPILGYVHLVRDKLLGLTFLERGSLPERISHSDRALARDTFCGGYPTLKSNGLHEHCLDRPDVVRHHDGADTDHRRAFGRRCRIKADTDLNAKPLPRLLRAHKLTDNLRLTLHTTAT